MLNIVFAAFSPHPPIILPSIGSPEDRELVNKTTKNLYFLRKELAKTNPETIIISSPHPDWGFEVPLYFLAKEFKGNVGKIITGPEPARFYYEKGKEAFIKINQKSIKNNQKVALIASGDLSHCLKKDGPYGFEKDGLKFDKDLIKALKKKDVQKILKLNELYPKAGECGLRSFCFVLGILQASRINYQPEILSYESPFGVGYLTVNFKLK